SSPSAADWSAIATTSRWRLPSVPWNVQTASGRPMRSILPEARRRGAASPVNSANLMLELPAFRDRTRADPDAEACIVCLLVDSSRRGVLIVEAMRGRVQQFYQRVEEFALACSCAIGSASAD